MTDLSNRRRRPSRSVLAVLTLACLTAITVDYQRDAGANTLTVTITQMPQGGDCAAAERKLRDAAGVCGAR